MFTSASKVHKMLSFFILLSLFGCDSSVSEPQKSDFFIADYDMNSLPVFYTLSESRGGVIPVVYYYKRKE